MTSVVHPRLAPRRSTARATTWWGKAWVRAIEEAAYADADLVASRALARGGHVGQIATEPGRFVASVEDRRGLWTVAGGIPVLDDGAVSALVEAVAAESGRIAALLAGDLPFSLVEHAEEAGVELLPYGAELSSTCTCDHWADPCTHALAVLHQLTWLLEADPFVLLQLRGLPRDELLGRLHARAEPAGDPDETEVDLDAAVEAALYAARLLSDAADAGLPGPPAPST
ncbi:SWIM zinc finger family protein [Nocardioides caricicola]|uniref:SWIM zinc finger family protein n=1 Tax=Nocardioides caricicola TaxID=634770 RepID=A0ABW0MZZ2_9ACTN